VQPEASSLYLQKKYTPAVRFLYVAAASREYAPRDLIQVVFGGFPFFLEH
jgi:hypothetical protein